MNRTQLDETIWELHVPLLRLAMSILRHPQNAEDAVSQAVITAYAKMDTLRQDSAAKAWLMKITARCCYDQLRKRKREVLAAEPELGASPFEEPLEGSLFSLLQRLPQGQAQVLTLYYYEGFSIAETASVLGLTQATVSMRLSRGRKRLKEWLMEEESEVEADACRG